MKREEEKLKCVCDEFDAFIQGAEWDLKKTDLQEQRRYEIAKTMLPALYERFVKLNIDADAEQLQALVVAGAIEYADRLIEQLKQ